MPGTTLQIETPYVFLPFLQPSRYKGAYGGRGSTKSHSFAELLIERTLLHPGTRAVCIREIQKSLEQSVKRLLEDKIRKHKLESQFRMLTTHIETPGDGIIIFNGMQSHNADSIKSLEGYDIAWVEEAQSLSQRSLNLLRPTIREENSEIWCTWNPDSPKDPVDEMLRGPNPPPNSIVIGSTFRDNPWFPEVLRAEMEWDRSRDTEKYEHIWEGEYEKHSEARVFKNWRIEEFETPDDATFYLGGDWGFSVDPNVLVRLWLRKSASGGRDTIMIDNEAYAIGCEIDNTPDLFDRLVCNCTPPLVCTSSMHGWARNWKITADSARPETISYLRRHGYPFIEAAVKGANSVLEGIVFLQGYDIIIHPRCRHTIDEFRSYKYKTDAKTGEILPILEDKKNHVIDSVRYAIEKLRAISMRMQVITLKGF